MKEEYTMIQVQEQTFHFGKRYYLNIYIGGDVKSFRISRKAFEALKEAGISSSS